MGEEKASISVYGRTIAVFMSLLLAFSLIGLIGTQPEDAFAAGAKKYKIIYKLNGGTQAKKQTKKVKKGKTIKVSKLKKPTRKGYSFKGWYKDKKLTKKATSVKGSKKKSKRTLYAKWALKSYKITYKLNGGKISGSYAKKYKYTKGAKLPTPTRKGYTFQGWYKDKKFKKKISGISSKTTGNKTVYAKWKAIKYSITYNLNGGKLPSGAAKSYKTSKAVTLPTPTRAGYSFMGWHTNAGLTKYVASIKKGSTGNKTYYAKWQKRFFIAHRGYHVDEPQNSIAAFRAAAAKGFEYVEADVRFTKDGVPVLSHDAEIPVWITVEPEEPDPEPEPEPEPENPDPIASGGEGVDGQAPEDDGVSTLSEEDSTSSMSIESDAEGDDDEVGSASEQAETETLSEENERDSEGGDLQVLGSEDEPDGELEFAEVIEGENYLEGIDADGYVEILMDDECLDEEPAVDSGLRTLSDDGDDEVEKVQENWKISSHTYDEWQEAELVGEPAGPDGANLSTYEDFLATCVECGLHPRIDVKAGNRSQIASLMDMLAEYGLQEGSSWCTGSFTILEYFASHDSKATIGLYMAPITEANLQRIKDIASGGNPIFTHTSRKKATESAITLCKKAQIPLGVYSVPNESYASKMDQYIYEYTIDGVKGSCIPDTF